jgi:PAS domain S-box-containing protein
MQSLELALLYDEEGKLTDVIEGSGLFDSVPFGTSLETLMDSGSLEKAQRFLSLIQNQGAAFDWELNVRIADGIRSLHFAGAKWGDTVLLVGATSRAAVSGTFERVASKRGFPKWAAGPARTDPVQPDDSVYCELSRLNNELLNSERELAKKNAEVEQRVEERTKELSEMNRELQQHDALLRSREELLKIFVQNVPAAVAMLDRDMRYVQVSQRWCTDYLPGRTQILGCSHYEIFPDMPERWKQVHRRALDGETLRADEDRWDGQDGPHWARWEVRPWKTPEGAVGGVLILAEDITRRKQMEEALSKMSRKLIESQEQERARIGRELHDDINQRLAMLSLELEQLQENPSEVRSRVQALRQQTTELSNDVQALSHELHSSKLEYLGAIGGMKSWCNEFGERQGIQIEVKTPEAKISLPPEVGLCLFRVLQEALHNATKYSGVKRIEVQLREDSGEIHLIIRDSGKGFDLETAMQGRGLGLTSMRERVRLVNGTIEIQSKPGGGTTIHVRVPLASDYEADRATG